MMDGGGRRTSEPGEPPNPLWKGEHWEWGESEQVQMRESNMETMYYNPNYNRKKHLKLRIKLRRKQTPAEAALWEELKNRKFLNLKFYRQFGVGQFIVDFFCPKLKLSIELDGGHHKKTDQREYDAIRTKYLKGEGIMELRFENVAVTTTLPRVLKIIRTAAERRSKQLADSSPHPPTVE